MRVVCLAAAGLLLACGARADVTLRYQFDFRPGAMLPPQAVEAMKKQMGALMPMKSEVRVKANKAYSTMGPISCITDFDLDRMTLLDPKNKTFAAAAVADYPSQVAPRDLPPEARKALDSMKIDVQSKVTGRTEKIHGIDTEERELTMTMAVPAPTGAPGPTMVVQYQTWTALPSAIEKSPALRELSLYFDRSTTSVNPMQFMQKMFAQAPGVGEKFRGMFEEMVKNRLTLKMRGAVKVALPAGAPTPPGMNPDSPMMEFLLDLEEISTAAVPDSVFAVPAGFRESTMAEVLKAVMPAPPAPAAAK